MSDLQGIAIVVLSMIGILAAGAGVITLFDMASDGSRSAVLALWSIAATVLVLLVLAACGVFG